MSMKRWVIGAVVVALIAAGTVQGASVLRERARRESRREARALVDRWFRLWARADWPAMRRLTEAAPTSFESTHGDAFTTLGIERARYRHGPVRFEGDDPGATFTAELELEGFGPYRYRGRLPIRRRDGTWRVRWTPAVLHPLLTAGRRFERVRSFAPRAPVLDVTGAPVDTRDPDVATIAGTVGPATSEQAEALGPPYLAGDEVGQSGLEAAFEPRLAGAPAGELQVVEADGTTVETLLRTAGSPPQPVQTGIDPRLQELAGRALEGVTKPAAIVAIDAPSGEVRAVVSHPAGGFPRALQGRYPPGSTFKIITASAALGSGRSPDEMVDCPPDVRVSGRRFTNAEGEALGPIPFRDAFAHSCNTAFINVATSLPPDALRTSASTFGFGGYELPVTAFTPTFPEPSDEVEAAASAIGQARVETSPVHMASVAAAVASGTWKAPRLAREQPPGAQNAVPGAPALREFMRLAVTSGTGTAANVAGAPVHGKTGTAEFGTNLPPQTHAWFVGFRGDLAFAVLVEDGGFGAEVAAPIAARFLRSL
jgi:cell division protein FtsI/penicillin-binding protein 2